MVHHRDDLGSHIDASAETQDLDIVRLDMRITATFQTEISRDRSNLYYIYLYILYIYILYHIWRYLGVYSHPWISAILMLGILNFDPIKITECTYSLQISDPWARTGKATKHRRHLVHGDGTRGGVRCEGAEPTWKWPRHSDWNHSRNSLPKA